MKGLRGFTIGSFLMAMTLPAFASVPVEVGSAQMIRGTVTAQLQEQGPRTLEKASPVFETDQITTGAKSFAVIKLKDGTRITVRPDSQLSIKKYTFEEGKEEAEFDLVKGGMRALTGLMGKTNPDATNVKTAYATMGIRGTSYDIRLCDTDCVQEQKTKRGIVALSSLVVARAVNISGGVTAVSIEGESRHLSEGAPVYNGDQLITDANGSAMLVFRDNTRLALQPGSKFALKSYSYQDGEKAGGRFDGKLLKGNLQVKPGAIGREYPEGFRIHTAKRTIGAEGTRFTADDSNVDLNELFAVQDHDFTKPGTYVTVYDGHVHVSKSESKVAGQAMVASLDLLSGFELLAQANPDKKDKPDKKETEFIDLGRGEAAFVDTESLYRITPPLFMTEDCYPHPVDFDNGGVWPPIFFQGDACAAVWSHFKSFGIWDPMGGPDEDAAFDQPIPVGKGTPEPETPEPETPGPEAPGTPGPGTPGPGESPPFQPINPQSGAI